MLLSETLFVGAGSVTCGKAADAQATHGSISGKVSRFSEHHGSVSLSQQLTTPPPFQVEVSPLENAIEVIENKNLQLRTLITQCQSRQMQNINPLTMCLNGVIDAAVNGGLARYQEVRMDGWMGG